MNLEEAQIISDFVSGKDKSFGIEINQFKIKEMESIPENSNPFHYDVYHMGTNINDVTIMHSDIGRYLIIIDRPTGKRIKIILPKLKDE